MKVRLDWKGDFGSPEKQGYDRGEGRSRGDAKVAAPLAAFLHNPLAVQELRANKKELNGSLVDGWKWSRPNGGHAGLT
ncbi:uncharacterized protein DS421_10g300170 [Arachis hypogaea]|nr:uncharacterized protein DS421_10g300170 [Arachis hypogaea]